MDNMASIVKRHNAKILKSNVPNTDKKSCSCRNKAICPLNGACLKSNLVYKATVSAQGHDKIYIGMTKHSFKTRFNNHNLSINHEKHSAKTTLSKYAWELIRPVKLISQSSRWSVLKRASAYKASATQCNLCLAKKFCILTADKQSLLNRRLELFSKCRHENKFYAANRMQVSTINAGCY